MRYFYCKTCKIFISSKEATTIGMRGRSIHKKCKERLSLESMNYHFSHTPNTALCKKFKKWLKENKKYDKFVADILGDAIKLASQWEKPIKKEEALTLNLQEELVKATRVISTMKNIIKTVV